MTREKIEAQLKDARTEIAVIEHQLTLPRPNREGQKHGTQLNADRMQARKRVKDLEKWLESGLFDGRGGGRTNSPSGERREVRR